MKNPEIVRLAHGEIPGPIHVGRIPRVWADQLGASTCWVKFSFFNLCKQAGKHQDVELGFYEDIDWILEHGEVIFDPKDNVLHFVGDTRAVCGHRTKVTVKATRGRSELFMTSAHRLRERDYNRLKRKALHGKN